MAASSFTACASAGAFSHIHRRTVRTETLPVVEHGTTVAASPTFTAIGALIEGIAQLGRHPEYALYIVVVCMILCCACSAVARWRLMSQPFPENVGGRVTKLKTVADFEALVAAAAARGQLVVVDAYATWCPPCRVAAPAFARMSEKYDARFAKVDVDEASELQALLRVSVLPTFKIFRPAAPAFRAARDGDGVKGVKVPAAAPPEEVASVRGWDPKALARAFLAHGVDQIEEHELLAQSAQPDPEAGETARLVCDGDACERPRK